MLSLILGVTINRSVGDVIELVLEPLLLDLFQKFREVFDDDILETFLEGADRTRDEDTFGDHVEPLAGFEDGQGAHK